MPWPRSFSASAALLLALGLVGCRRTAAAAGGGGSVLVAGQGEARLVAVQTLSPQGKWPLPGAVVGAARSAGRLDLALATPAGGEVWSVGLGPNHPVAQHRLGLRPSAWSSGGNAPAGFAFAAGSAADGGALVEAVDLATGALRPLFSTAAPATALTLDAEHHLLAAVGNRVAVYSLPSGRGPATPLAPIRLAAPARQLVALPYGHKAFALCGDQVAVLDTAHAALLTYLRTGGEPQNLLVKPDGGELYISNADGTVTAVDTTRNEVSATMAAGSGAGPMAASPDGSVLYVGNAAAGTISVVDLGTRRNLALVRIGQQPAAVLLAPNGYVFVADAGSDDLAVVRGNQDANNPNTLISLLPSPPRPAWVVEGSR